MRGEVDSEMLADSIADLVNRSPRTPTREEIAHEIEAQWGVPRGRSRPVANTGSGTSCEYGLQRETDKL